MRRVHTLLTRACLRAYPRAWRERYGDELLRLTDEADGGIGDLIDLTLAGLRRRLENRPGGDPMARRINPRQAALAGGAALLVVAPTALFMGMNLVGWPAHMLSGVRMPGDADAIRPLEVLPVLPLIALVIAIAPAVRVDVRRGADDGLATVTVRFLAMPRWLVYVTLACAVVAAAVVAYGISVNVLAPR